MSRTYVTILASEMDNILKTNKGWTKASNGHQREIVYQYTLQSRPYVTIKVYSSIHEETSLSRKCGADAIRVCAINNQTNRGLAKSTRINRVPGWEARLKTRVIEVINTIKSR